MGRVAAFSKRVGSALGRIGPQQPVLPVKVDAVKDKKKEEAKAKEKMVRNDKVVLLFVFQVGSTSMAWRGRLPALSDRVMLFGPVGQQAALEPAANSLMLLRGA